MIPGGIYLRYDTQEELHYMVKANAYDRWYMYSDLGVSLLAMRELGHWSPFTSASRKLYAKIVAKHIVPWRRGRLERCADEVAARREEHQQSRRVGPPTPYTDVLPLSRGDW